MSELKKGDGDSWGAALIANMEDGREVGFRCVNGKMLVAFALEPTDMMEAFKDSGKPKLIDVDVSINGVEEEDVGWALLRRHNVVLSGDQKTARRMYNAVVRRETVSIQTRKKGGDFSLPDPNSDAFSSFMNACDFKAKDSA